MVRDQEVVPEFELPGTESEDMQIDQLRDYTDNGVGDFASQIGHCRWQTDDTDNDPRGQDPHQPVLALTEGTMHG